MVLVDWVVYRPHAAYPFGSFVMDFMFCALGCRLEMLLELLCTANPLPSAYLGVLSIGRQGEWKGKGSWVHFLRPPSAVLKSPPHDAYLDFPNIYNVTFSLQL